MTPPAARDVSPDSRLSDRSATADVDRKEPAMLHHKEGLGSTSVDSASEIRVGREHLFHALPPHESYEGHHRWDPAFEWDEAEERRLVRKTDLFLLTWLCVMFFGLQLDRGNVQNALTDDLLTDLNMSSNDYVSFPPGHLM